VTRDPREVRRCLGFHSASTALYPRLTARETLEFFASVNGYPADRLSGRVKGLVEQLGISAFAEVRVDRLSSGMKQKVAVARTLAHDPPVLIFDEPTVGLDVLVALDMQEVIRGQRDQGKTVILSTHVMSEAEKLCDRIAIIHAGRILACDTLGALREATGRHYLEDIFVHFVRPGQALAAPGGRS
jgi:sodium transport system ATP-binding protein